MPQARARDAMFPNVHKLARDGAPSANEQNAAGRFPEAGPTRAYPHTQSSGCQIWEQFESLRHSPRLRVPCARHFDFRHFDCLARTHRYQGNFIIPITFLCDND
jgi:hypothetical protein